MTTAAQPQPTAPVRLTAAQPMMAPLVNGPTWVTGHNGYAVSFDGADDYVDLGSSTLFDTTVPHTISAWTKLGGYGSNILPVIVNFKTEQAHGFSLYFSNDSNFTGIGFGCADAGFISLKTSGDISASLVGVWKHVVMVYDGVALNNAASYKLYLNGVEQTIVGGGNWTCLNVNYFGTDDFSSSDMFNGPIDDVRLYNRALSAGEVQDLYTQGSLVGWWKLDDNSGTSATDSSCYGGSSSADKECNTNTGTLTNGPTWVTGHNKYAVNFDGSDDYVSIANSSVLQISNGTISAWIKTNGAGSSFRGIVVKEYAYGMFLGGNICADNVLGLYDWSAPANRCSSSGSLADGKWHHVVESFQSGVSNGTAFYVDGIAAGTTDWTVSNQSSPVTIDTNNSNPQNFNGSIDDVRIYDRVLSDAEIRKLYLTGRGDIHSSGD